MRGVVALDRGIRASGFRPALRDLHLPGTAAVALLVPQLAFAQRSPTLPEIQIIGTTPLPPVRPAAAPGSRSSGRAQVSPANPATSSGPISEAGGVARDKVPSNVQMLAAPDFDHAIT